MKIRELIKQLKQLSDKHPDAILVMSGDPEGNYFHVLSEIEYMVYMPDQKVVAYAELTAELRRQGYTEDDVSSSGIPAIVLWP